MSYRQTALDTYGDRCEICSYGIVEVHHIDYKLHTEWEQKIRIAFKLKASNLDGLLARAKELGFLNFEYNQLDKDDRSTNLCVLCPNCHSLIHKLDSGVDVLKALPPRR